MLMKKRSSMAVSSSNNTSPSNNSATSRALLGFSAKRYTDTDPTASPTSILEHKPFSSPTASHFSTDRKPRPTWHNAEAVGLGIVDALRNEKPEYYQKSSNQESRMVLFGSQLKIQIPSIHSNSVSPPGSPIEFGVKNKSSQLALLSPPLRSPLACSGLVASLSASDMELSEDYTCVIAHGPNPRTTHIFDNCIVESCCGGRRFVPSRMEESSFGCHSNDFLAFCHACKKSLGPGKDIFMYRGEKAFCSSECRYHEMLFDEELEE